MESQVTVEEIVEPVPPPVAEETASSKKAPKVEKESEDGDEPAAPGKGGPLSKEMKEHRANEERTLREIVEAFGDSTAYKIKVTRKAPQTVKDRLTGKVHTTAGFLEYVDGIPIDESWLMDRYGGGKYELIFRDRDAKGRWKYAAQATIEIAGEPDLKALPGANAETPATNAAAASEPTSITTRAMDMMNEQLRRAEERAERTPARTDDAMIELLRDQLRTSQAELAAIRQELHNVVTRPPPQTTEDKMKDRLFEKLIDGDSARITAVRTQFESEIRQIKDAAREDEKRLYDRFDRERQDLRNAHERELALLRTTHDTALTAAKMSYETQLAAARSSFDTQKEILKADNSRLSRDNERLQDEVKELRAKKEKTLVETAKELETVKEALGLGDGDERGWGDKLADFATNPEAISALGQVIRGPAVAAPPPPPQQAAPARTRPRVVRDKTDGKKYIEHPNGTRQGPLPEKPPAGAVAAPAGPPPIDPAVMSQMVVMLENAYSNGTDPEMVARTAKPHVSDNMLMLIRDVGGVDAFLSKVAKLPGSSPLLSTQAGRNWVRKVGKGLVGDDE